MFRAVSRRTSACTSKLVQAQRPSLTRAIYTNNARPTPQLKPKGTQLTLSQISRPRQITFAQRVRLHYREASKGIFRKNPILLPLAIVGVVSAIGTFVYISYVEVTRVGPQYHKFPPPVADALRTAVYYTEIDLNPPKALQAYKEALRIAAELGMHPFSDEVLGIKLQVAMMLEKAGLVKPAIEVLERTKDEALKWVDQGHNAGAATVGLAKNGVPASVQTTADKVQKETEAMQDAEKELREMQEFEARQRDRTLKKVVGMQMKLGELYGSDHIQDEKKAEAAQVAAVELCLKEMHRREKLGLPVGGGGATEGGEESWLNMTEIATALGELASTYSAKERHDLALPLYLRALDLIRGAEGDSPSCKQVGLLNNVASALVGQVQQPARNQKSVTPEQSIDAARQWAQKSLDVAARIQPPVRDEECDISCVAATYNLGELAELQNKPDVAQQRYLEAKSLAKGLGFEEGIAMADEALGRLAKK
ncbi:hypothetical protein N7520_001123 [Penicillium odoratum]|uniref:uncharacterized protein n=1 Tax=Penicillium odoratum TaxID=1167516 RepID=UPI0025499DD7|nr:uncharacterized protein N7520_001123 [Penicillium odoratum]KAJ5777877.1 hypothetical protein N7520_001123 [Penicillium odoratum]